MEGEINLNSIVYNRIITKEDILKHVTQEEIYSLYLGEDISQLGVYHSPLRDDNIPSFGLYFHKVERNTLMFYDFATRDSGDFVVLVCKLFNLPYVEALKKIAFDLGLSHLSVEANKQNIQYTRILQKEQVKLGVKLRNWSVQDKAFWSSFGIKKATLIKFNVFPISHVFYNDTGVKTSSLAYVYAEFKDGITSYKIYQPFETKIKKWINNANYSVHQGYKQLPNKGKILIVTKSLKDVMSIHDCLNIPAIGLQSESVMMKDSVMDEYKNRFEHVICLFDNDEAGKKLTAMFSEAFQIPFFFVPELPKVTDFSDLVKSVGVTEATSITKKLIKNEIRNR